MKTKLVVSLAVLLFGLIRMPLEHRLTEEHRAAYFHTARLNLDLRQRIGQMGFLAALSGFRAIVADGLWIEAYTAFERTEWGRMALLFDTVTSLQPRALLFWDMAAWHMAWNASVAALYDEKQPREALRIKAQREYFRLGEDFLLRGIQNNPDRPLLYERLGGLYREKFNDHEKAFAAYDQGMRLPGAPEYLKRFAAYELALIPGREAEAYARLKELYLMGEKEHLPTLLKRLESIEEKMRIPPEKRIYNPGSSP